MSRTPEQLAQERRTECRGDVLAYLAQRLPLSYTPATIRKRLNDESQTDYSDEEIDAAIAFLVDAGEVKLERQHRHGTARYYQATSQGVLAYERNT